MSRQEGEDRSPREKQGRIGKRHHRADEDVKMAALDPLLHAETADGRALLCVDQEHFQSVNNQDDREADAYINVVQVRRHERNQSQGDDQAVQHVDEDGSGRCVQPFPRFAVQGALRGKDGDRAERNCDQNSDNGADNDAQNKLHGNAVCGTDSSPT